MNPRVLVTGASGFIGLQVVAALSSMGIEVHSAGLNTLPGDENKRARRCDLLSHEAVERLLRAVSPTHLVHLAWYVEHGKFWRSAENLAWLEASLHLVRRFAEGGGQRVVVAGTCAEYDWRHGYCVEGVTPCEPATLYGASKDALRRTVQAFAGEHGLSWSWGRVFHLYGPGEPDARLVPSVALSLLRGNAPRCTAGTQLRDLMHVSDVGRAFATLVTSELEGPVNVATGVPVRLGDVVRAIAKHFPDAPAPVFGALAAPQDEPPLLVGDATRLHALGFRPRHDLESGIADAVAHLRARHSAAS